MSSRLGFRVEARATGSRARAARFRTLHNEVVTPLFMPVGTQATVKAQTIETLETSGSQILLANTYHLLLRPGPDVFDKLGGYHGFTTWKRSVLTDSGGFQIFSLPETREMREEGAAFRSYIDGTEILLSPEKSISTQRSIGSDIMMVLDQCIPSTADETTARRALGITHRWAERSKIARGDSPQSLFGIVQGALFPELRRESAQTISEMGFDGLAIGGLAVGESKSEREDTCELTCELLPEDLPRYLMGVGTPLDILEAVHRGVDMFDCIIPTQVAQRGSAFTSRGIIKIRRQVYRFSEEPLDPDCSCPTCARFSRAYLHHLSKASEPLGWTLLGQHNIYFYHQLMASLRQAILEDRFMPLYRQLRARLHAVDVENPTEVTPPARNKRRLGAYEVVEQAGGFGSIRHLASQEIMHARTPPMDEAHALYIEQSQLPTTLEATSEAPLVVWDVGLGAAANAMAALRTWENSHESRRRELHIVSFENDLDSLRLARRHNRFFPYLRHPAPAAILGEGTWTSSCGAARWHLRLGDFRDHLRDELPTPDLIFFDMFSSQTNSDEWTLACFEEVFAHCRDHRAELFTYSASTAVRANLLAAGFHVARGVGTGVKGETTIAVTPLAASNSTRTFLSSDWLTRWRRSSAQFPVGITETERARYAARIESHEQFASVPSPP